MRGKELGNCACCLGPLVCFETGAFQSPELYQGLSRCVLKGTREVGGAWSFPFLSAWVVTSTLTSSSGLWGGSICEGCAHPLIFTLWILFDGILKALSGVFPI